MQAMAARNRLIPWYGVGIGQVSLWYRAGRRPDGTASTATQSANIANPMNSNTNASNTAIPPLDRQTWR
jgi:hypothetical protein